MNNEIVQEMLASLQVPVKLRAQIRALGRGRPMATYWDVMVAAVENAIGLFTRGRAGTSYMDQLLRIYPHVALSSAEQMRDAEIRLKPGEIDDRNTVLGTLGLGAVFNDSVKRATDFLGSDTKVAGQAALNALVTPTNTIRRRAAKIFGSFDNPVNRLLDQLEELQRRVELKMQVGDRIDDQLRRWMMEDSTTNRPYFEEMHDLIVNSSIDGIDPRIDLQGNHWIRNDADHPLSGGRRRRAPTFKHMRDSWKRQAHARYKARWDALPDEMKALVSQRLDHMKAMMLEYETTMVEGFLDRLLDSQGQTQYHLPPGMSRSDAVKEIMDDNMSDELKTALGDHAKTIGQMGKFGTRDGMYAPASRMGNRFISGRRKIPTPTPTRGQLLLDQGQGPGRIFRWFSTTCRTPSLHQQRGGTGERVLKFQRKYIDPRDGTFVGQVALHRRSRRHRYQAQPVC
jgi:hypothetical protein